MGTIQIPKKAGILLLLAFFFMMACDQSSNPFGLDENESTTSLSKGIKVDELDMGGLILTSDFSPYSYSDSITIPYKKGNYKSCKIKLQDGSKLAIKAGSIVPPSDYADMDSVTITMQVDRTAEGEVTYTFGPHGTQFLEAAEITFSYSNISGKSEAKLFYINDDGEFEEQRPDQIDRKGNKMYLNVDHFSRYAVAYGR